MSYKIEARNTEKRDTSAWSEDYAGAGVRFASEPEAEAAIANLRATDESWDSEGWELRVVEVV